MPQAVLKSQEISNELIDLLKSRTQIGEMRFYAYIRDIEKVSYGADKLFLKALANGAYGRKDESIRFFEDSLSQSLDALVVQNYIAYLSDYSAYLDVVDVVKRFANSFVSKAIVGYGWETSLFSGNLEEARVYAEKFIKISDAEEANAMRRLSSDMLSEAITFKDNAGLSDVQYKDVASRMLKVVDDHEVKPLAVGFHNVPEEGTSSCFMLVDTIDADVLSDMNLAVAFSLAENDGLVGKRFSVWFEGDETSAS